MFSAVPPQDLAVVDLEVQDLEGVVLEAHPAAAGNFSLT